MSSSAFQHRDPVTELLYDDTGWSETEPPCGGGEYSLRESHDWAALSKGWNYRYYCCGCGAYWREPRGAFAAEGKKSEYKT